MAIRLHNKYRSNLAESTWELLDRCTMARRELASKARVNYHWLVKFEQRGVKNPTLKHIERLHAFLTNGEAKVAA